MLLLRRAINLGLAGQAVTIKVSANLVVQAVKRTSDPEHHASVDWRQVLEFALYGLVGSQVGNIIQFVLEDWFPTKADSALPGANGHSLVGGLEMDEMKPKEKTDDEPSSSASSSAKAAARRCVELGPDVSWRNLAAKLVLDQTIGLLISACIFLVCTNVTRVGSAAELAAVVRERAWPLIRAGWHIWPLVAVCNFVWVPVRRRVLVAVCVGFGWSIFLTLFANNNKR